jgi:hypothetical protein
MFYTVSGSNIGCRKQYVWCNTGEQFNKEVPWKTRDNMYNEERCTMLMVVPFQTGLADMPCEDQLKFICEVIFSTLNIGYYTLLFSAC